MNEKEYRIMLLEFYKENSKFMEKLIPSTSLVAIGAFISKVDITVSLSCYMKMFFLFFIFCFALTIVLSVYTIVKTQKIIRETYEDLKNEKFQIVEILEDGYRWLFIISLCISFIFISTIVIGG
ncbi:hypothetical protein [Francisella orientalis]|uniref:Uncharacterized protein n=1 Tax=Francisella orientalis TaxID=299583 RepID=A0AAP7FVI1_9GAMM|nr:hypothetical protein [Francisella orientalis]AHB99220.1 hypothetical protein M973_06210 [Francisella orientalis LADL 07-285A]AKN85731.1 hypothetical protein FNO12_1108 [Francisella orientalis FNO12]AKN87271.1 Hypothetical protein FNO24_1110 [Francisella orientalis FNO24]AKN88808.1 Hypothetical protein FNO190_1108 [Francisella orientalis]AKU05566.1 Hypothetical protein FNO01_1108 [Francisella orientalis]